MSLHSVDMLGGAGRGDGTSAQVERVPRLLSPARYAAWRPQMNVFLTQRGLGDVLHKQRTTDEWDAMVALVRQATDDEETTALAALGIGTTKTATTSSGSGTTKTITGHGTTLDAQRVVRSIVERSRRAFGYLYAALPDELRPQVAHLPEGLAYALWQWIEGKYQSKESDNVSALFAQWTALEQMEDETFDAYRARVNTLAELLGNADERPSARMYAYTLLERLRPHYQSVVLALHNGQALRRTKKITTRAEEKETLDIDWTEITRLINAHERSEQRMGQREGESDQAMSARRAYSARVTEGQGLRKERTDSRSDGRSTDQPDWDERGRPKCFNCNQYGHMSKRCTKPAKTSRKGRDRAPTPNEDDESGQDEGTETASSAMDGGFAL